MENQANIIDQNAQPVGQNPVVQPTILDKPRTNFAAMIAIGLVCSLVFGVGGYFLGKQSSKSTQVVDQSQTRPTPISTNMTYSNNIEDMSGWKIYKNAVFELKYPSFLPNVGLRAKGYGEESSPDIYESSYHDLNQGGGGPGYTTLFRVIGPEANPNKLTLEKWIEEQGLNTGGYRDQLPRTIKNITIDSKPAIVQTGIGSGFTVPTEFYLHVSNGDNIYSIIYFLSVNEEGAKKYQTDFDNIISTFKFVN